MPALVFPAPGCPAGQQITYSFVGFDLSRNSGASFVNILKNSKDLSSGNWIRGTGRSSVPDTGTYNIPNWHIFDYDVLPFNNIYVKNSTANGTNLVTSNSSTQYLGQVINVNSNTTYTASFLARKGTASSVTYGIRDLTNSRDIVSATNYVSQINTLTLTRISFSFQTNTTTSQIIFYPLWNISTGTTGTVYISSPQVQAGSTLTSYDQTFDRSLATEGITSVDSSTYRVTSVLSQYSDPLKNFEPICVTGQSKVKWDIVKDYVYDHLPKMTYSARTGNNTLTYIPDSSKRRYRTGDTITVVNTNDKSSYRQNFTVTSFTSNSVTINSTATVPYDSVYIVDPNPQLYSQSLINYPLRSNTVRKSSYNSRDLLFMITYTPNFTGVKYSSDPITISSLDFPQRSSGVMLSKFVARPDSIRVNPGVLKYINKFVLPTPNYVLPKVTSTSTSSIFFNLGRYPGGIPRQSNGINLDAQPYLTNLPTTVDLPGRIRLRNAVLPPESTRNAVSVFSTALSTSSILFTLARFPSGIIWLASGISPLANDAGLPPIETGSATLKTTTALEPFDGIGITTGDIIRATGQSNIAWNVVNEYIFDEYYKKTTTSPANLTLAYNPYKSETDSYRFAVNRFVKISNRITGFSTTTDILSAGKNTITVKNFPEITTNDLGQLTIQDASPFVYPTQAVVNSLLPTLKINYQTQYARENLLFSEYFTPNVRGLRYDGNKTFQSNLTPPDATGGRLSTWQEIKIPGDFRTLVTSVTTGTRYNTLRDYIYDLNYLSYTVNTQTLRTLYFPRLDVAAFQTGDQVRIRNDRGFNQVYNVLAGKVDSVVIPIQSTFTNIVITGQTTTSTSTTVNTRVDVSSTIAVITQNRNDIEELGSASMSEIFAVDYPEYINTDDWYYVIPTPFQILFAGNFYPEIYLSTNSYFSYGVANNWNWYDDVGDNIDVPRPDWEPPPEGPLFVASPGLYISSYNNKIYKAYTVTEGSAPNRTFRVRYEGYGYQYNSGDPTLVWEAVYYEDPLNAGYGNGIVDIIKMKDNRGAEGVTGISDGLSWLETNNKRYPWPNGGIPTVTVSTSTYSYVSTSSGIGFVTTSAFPVSSNLTIERVVASVYPQSYVYTNIAPTSPREVAFYVNLAPGLRTRDIFSPQIGSGNFSRLVVDKLLQSAVVKAVTPSIGVNKLLTINTVKGSVEVAKIFRSESLTTATTYRTTVAPIDSNGYYYYFNIAPGYRYNKTIQQGAILHDRVDNISVGKLAASANIRGTESKLFANNLQKDSFKLRTPTVLLKVDKLNTITVVRDDRTGPIYYNFGGLQYPFIWTKGLNKAQVFDTPTLAQLPKQPVNLKEGIFRPTFGNVPRGFKVTGLTSNLSVDKLRAITVLKDDRTGAIFYNFGGLQYPFNWTRGLNKAQVFETPLSSKLSVSSVLRAESANFALGQLQKQISRLTSGSTSPFFVEQLQRRLFKITSGDPVLFQTEQIQKRIFELRPDTRIYLDTELLTSYKTTAFNTQVFFTPRSDTLKVASVLRSLPSNLNIERMIPKLVVRSENTRLVVQALKITSPLKGALDSATYWSIDALEKLKLSANQTQIFYTPTSSILEKDSLKIKDLVNNIFTGLLEKDSFKIKEPSYKNTFAQGLPVVRYYDMAPSSLIKFFTTKIAFVVKSEPNRLKTETFEKLKISADRTQIFYTPTADKLSVASVLKDARVTITADKLSVVTQLRDDKNRPIYYNFGALQTPFRITGGLIGITLFNAPTSGKLQTSFTVRSDRTNISSGLVKSITSLKSIPSVINNIENLQKRLSNLNAIRDKQFFDINLLEKFKPEKLVSEGNNLFSVFKLSSAQVLRAGDSRRILLTELLEKPIAKLTGVQSILRQDNLYDGLVVRQVLAETILLRGISYFDKVRQNANNFQVWYVPSNIGQLTKQIFNLKFPGGKIDSGKLNVIQKMSSGGDLLTVSKLSSSIIVKTDSTRLKADVINKFFIPSTRTQIFYTPNVDKLSVSQVVKGVVPTIKVDRLSTTNKLVSENQRYFTSAISSYADQTQYYNFTSPNTPLARYIYQRIAPGFRWNSSIQQGSVFTNDEAKVRADKLSTFDNLGPTEGPLLPILTSSDALIPITGRTSQTSNNVVLWYIQDRDVLTILPVGTPTVTLYFSPLLFGIVPFAAGNTVRIQQANTGYSRDLVITSANSGSITFADPGDLPSISSMTVRRIGTGYPVTVYFNNADRPFLTTYPVDSYVKLENTAKQLTRTAQVIAAGTNFITYIKTTDEFFLEAVDSGTISSASVAVFERARVQTNLNPTIPRENLFYAELVPALRGYIYGPNRFVSVVVTGDDKGQIRREVPVVGGRALEITAFPGLLDAINRLKSPSDRRQTSFLPKQLFKLKDPLDFRKNPDFINRAKIRSDSVQLLYVSPYGIVTKFITGDYKPGSTGIKDLAVPKKEPIQFWN